MSQKVRTLLIDDLDGSTAERTIRFDLDGAEYEIDLNDAHLAGLRQTLDVYVSAGRKVPGQTRRTEFGVTGTRSGGPSTSEVRRWARSRGMKVNDRGRLPAGMRAKFIATAGS